MQVISLSKSLGKSRKDIESWFQFAHPVRAELVDILLQWDQLLYWLALCCGYTGAKLRQVRY